MPNGTGNFRNFQIFRKKDNLRRLSTIFETNFQKRSVPFDFVLEFPEILVKWIAPTVTKKTGKNLVDYDDQNVNSLCSRHHYVNSSRFLHTAGAREIWIDQSGFSRWEKIHCPHVNVSWQERHWNQATFLIGECIKSVHPKISRIGRQKRNNEFFLIWPKEPISLPIFGKRPQKVQFPFHFFKICKTWKFGHKASSGSHGT